MAKNRGLGRGLAALVAEFPAGQVSLVELDVDQVRPNPRQPRTRFDDDAINALAESIKSEGVVQPIIVRDSGDGYQIVAGERRWRASQRAGLTTIPAIVRPLDEREAMIMALAENVAREDLNPVEQARAYAVLSDELDLSQTEIARRVGKSRPAVANTMRLLELPDAALELIESSNRRSGWAAHAGPSRGEAGAVGARHRGGGQAPGKAEARRASEDDVGRRGARAPGRGRGVAIDEAAGGGAIGPTRGLSRDPLQYAG